MNDIFKLIFENMMDKGLNRDQNIYCYVLDKMNIKKKDILMIQAKIYGKAYTVLNNPSFGSIQDTYKKLVFRLPYKLYP